MKRSIKALVVAGVMAASLFGAAAPASAENCIGVDYFRGPQNIGYWNCDSCPDQPHYGPLDGQFWVIVCF